MRATDHAVLLVRQLNYRLVHSIRSSRGWQGAGVCPKSCALCGWGPGGGERVNLGCGHDFQFNAVRHSRASEQGGDVEVVFGVHSVAEAVRVRPGEVDHVTVLAGPPNPRVAALLEQCRAARVRVAHGSRDELSRMTRTENHGGAAAFLRERRALSLEDLLQPTQAKRFLLALDGVEDPHNLGALLRTADGAGVDGVLVPERRSAPITGTVAKASAGATEHVRVARVTNLVRALEELKRQNIWIVGLDERGTANYDEFDFTGDIALVLGREGAGLHDLARKTCDFLLRIPMLGSVPSLNVSVAGAVVMFEAARQRRGTPATGAEPAPKPSKPRKGLGS